MHKAKRQREQLVVVLRETKHRSLELGITGRANLAKVLQEFYAEVQLEKSKFVMYHYPWINLLLIIFRDIAASSCILQLSCKIFFAT